MNIYIYIYMYVQAAAEKVKILDRPALASHVGPAEAAAGPSFARLR